MEFFKKKTNIDFIGMRKIWFGTSITLMIISCVLIFTKWNSNLSIDFVGGVLVQMKIEPMVPLEDIRGAVEQAGYKNVQLQRFQSSNEITIKLKREQGLMKEAVSAPQETGVPAAKLAAANTAASGSETGSMSRSSVESKITAVLQNSFPGSKIEVQRVEMVGSAVSKELGRKTFWAFFWGMIGIMVYVAWRFEIVYSVPAVISLLHDVPIALGFLLLMNKEITLTIVAALLTLAGYSINDTIVIYDRIREKVRFYPKDEIGKVMNIAINDTLSRTFLTGGVTLLALLAMFFLGGEALHDFAYMMIVGIIVGTYSSIFIASALVYEWVSSHRK